jgi:hypothetical protein
MSIILTIHPERCLSYFRFYGRVDVKECADALRDYVRHPEFSTGLTMLSNTSALNHVEASFISMVMGIDRLSTIFKLFACEAHSVIHARDDIIFGMARMMQQITEPVSPFRFSICRSEAEALLLAGQPEPDFETLDHNLGLTGRPLWGLDRARAT